MDRLGQRMQAYTHTLYTHNRGEVSSVRYKLLLGKERYFEFCSEGRGSSKLSDIMGRLLF